MDRNQDRATGLPSERWATVQHLAELYSMGEESVRRKARDGTWPSHRQGRTIRFSPEDQRRIEEMWEPTFKERKRRRREIQQLVSELA